MLDDFRRCPRVTVDGIRLGGTQFCGLTDDGYYHGIDVCDDCPYVGCGEAVDGDKADV